MPLTGKITTLFQDNTKKLPLFPRTKTDAVSNKDGETLTKILKDMKDRWDGCWIDFKDEDGNDVDEPYIHWNTDKNGKPITTGLTYVEDEVF